MIDLESIRLDSLINFTFFPADICRKSHSVTDRPTDGERCKTHNCKVGIELTLFIYQEIIAEGDNLEFEATPSSALPDEDASQKQSEKREKKEDSELDKIMAKVEVLRISQVSSDDVESGAMRVRSYRKLFVLLYVRKERRLLKKKK